VRTTAFSLVILGVITLGGPGCAPLRNRRCPAVCAPGADCVVFVADGAGDFQQASYHLKQLILRDHLPLNAVTFEWSHGYLHTLADQTHYRWARMQGHRLAETLLAYHAEHPGMRIYLMGHSAGAAVVLTAVEELPPDMVEGIVLLNPSISATYDLRPALANVRCAIDVFHSRADWIYLGVATRLVGTIDRSHRIPAGRYGFRPIGDDPEEAALYSKLRQHAWEPADRRLGHNGGHYGAYQFDYLRANVVPIFLHPGAPQFLESL
jgi:pimeloyl-ACP methyl ester carboxylesterase